MFLRLYVYDYEPFKPLWVNLKPQSTMKLFKTFQVFQDRFSA